MAAAVALQLLGLLLPIVGYRLWVYPVDEELAGHQQKVFGAAGNLRWIGALDQEGDDKRAAGQYRDGVRHLSPPLSAYIQTALSPRRKAAQEAFRNCFYVGAVAAFVGLVSNVVLSLGTSAVRSALASAVAGVAYGAGAGILFDLFPFTLERTAPNGLVGGAVGFGVAGLVLGCFVAALANRGFRRPHDL